MIVVKDIEYVEVDNDEIELIKYNGSFIGSSAHKPLMNPYEEMKAEREYIKGERFNNNGEQFYLGLSKKAEEILRMPMRCFNDLTNEAVALRRLNDKIGSNNILLEQRLDDFIEASIWQRIKYLFTGNL